MTKILNIAAAALTLATLALATTADAQARGGRGGHKAISFGGGFKHTGFKHTGIKHVGVKLYVHKSYVGYGWSTDYKPCAFYKNWKPNWCKVIY